MAGKKTDDDKKAIGTSQPQQQTQDSDEALGASFANIDSAESRGDSEANIGDD